MMRGVEPGKPTYTTAEIALFQDKHGHVIERARELLGVQHTKRADVFAATAKALLWYGEEMIAPFCERFRLIHWNGTGDPAALLYTNLVKAKAGAKKLKQHECYKITLAAVEAEVHGRTVTRLHVRNQDIFKWQQGWEVPPRR